MNSRPIYLDYNATTPVDPRVLETMLPYFQHTFGNSSSSQHTYGWEAEEAVDIAREQVARLMGAKSNEIIFTSGATEAINLALIGTYEVNKSKGNHIITSVTEHKAVLDVCKELESRGAAITYLGVNELGQIDLDALEQSITDQTILISIMHANNETGVLQPIQAITEIAKGYGVPVFSDATQAIGKTPFNAKDFNISSAACSSHKLYGPKGVGALFFSRNNETSLKPQIFGGGHEKGIRSGTLNVPGIVGFGKACELVQEGLVVEMQRLQSARDTLQRELIQLGSVKVNGQKADRLAHVLNISFHDIDGSKLMRALKGIAASQGSACNSAVMEPSHVLKAMGVSDRLALSSLRLSLGRFTTDEEVRTAIKLIRGAIEQLRMQLQ